VPAAPDSATALGQRSLTVAIPAFPLGVPLSLLPLGAATLLLGRVAGDLGISSNCLVAVLCLVGGLYLLDGLRVPGPVEVCPGRPHVGPGPPWAWVWSSVWRSDPVPLPGSRSCSVSLGCRPPRA